MGPTLVQWTDHGGPLPTVCHVAEGGGLRQSIIGDVSPTPSTLVELTPG